MSAPDETRLFRSRWMRTAAIPLSALYGAALRIKPAPAPRRVSRPVISVGNIHVGGVGKTPLVIALARASLEAGIRPAVVSRGYGGRLSRAGAIVAAGRSAFEVGDEPLEIARALSGVPVAIGAGRIDAARRVEEDADLLILDDGFQHRRLARDLDLLVLPASSRPGEERLLPWGRLREPLEALRRADALVRIAEEDKIPTDPTAWRRWTDAPIFEARRLAAAIRPYPGTVEPVAFLGRPVILFAGIANPGRFASSVEAAGGRIVERFFFSDHHVF